jgi:non-ribosomal peptide synthetase component E (peptide arylation enzyme)
MIGVRDPIPGVIYPPTERLSRYVEGGELELTSLTEALVASFRANAAKTAIASVEGDISFAELDSLTARFAAALIRLGGKPLDRVIFQAANSPELIVALLGCLRAGLIPVCTLAAHRESEIGYLGNHVGARFHIVQGDDAKFDLTAFALEMKPRIQTMRHIIALRGEPSGGVHHLRRLIDDVETDDAMRTIAEIEHDPFQVALFQLSGGTTGVPKVIPRLQNDYLLNARRTVEVMGFTAGDVMFMPMPIIHNACMICFLMPSLLSGATFTVCPDMSPEGWTATFRKFRPTFLGLIRPLLPRLDGVLAALPDALSTVRACWSPDGARLMREKYGLKAHAMFGMSEGLNLYTHSDDPIEAVDWTVGRPLSQFDEVRLVEPGGEDPVPVGEIGEMICRGPYTLSGYYNAPDRNIEAFTREGFYRSGDLMVQREIDGKLYFAFAGRTKDVVDRGSEKINCEEVENAVSTHEAIAGCAVVGMPDPVLGERVCAYIVLRHGTKAPGLTAMQEHLRVLGLAKFKWPERLEVITELPLSKVGKLDKAVLRNRIKDALARENPTAP